MKKYLFGLLTFILIGLINFGYCTNVSDLIQKLCPNGENNCSYYGYVDNLDSSWQTVVDFGTNLYGGNTICIRAFDFSETVSISDIGLGFTPSSNGNPYNPTFYNNQFGDDFICIEADRYLRMQIRGGYSPQSFYFEMFVLNDLLATSLPKLSSLECQQEYNLIPISSVDQNYCVNNGLCPSSPDLECPGSGDNWSALYINNIQHLGKPIINVTIPDYIFWDYSTDDSEFNLYVGSGYDQDYIDSVLSINSYRPDSGDFTDIFVSGLTFIMPYIVILLFIVFIRKFIKRIFK